MVCPSLVGGLNFLNLFLQLYLKEEEINDFITDEFKNIEVLSCGLLENILESFWKIVQNVFRKFHFNLVAGQKVC